MGLKADVKGLPRHNYFCEESRCCICLEDAMSLEKYLRENCGGANRDWLSLYRRFMYGRLGRSVETEFGWFDPVIFNPEHINAFIMKHIVLKEIDHD